MSNTPALDEICDDARAYIRIGDIESALAVLFEGIAPDQAAATRQGVVNAVGNLCLSLWETDDLAAGTRVARAALAHLIEKSGQAVEPEYLEIYVTALAETGSSPFPLERLHRQRNLVRMFQRVLHAPEGDIAECGCARGMSSLQLCLAFGNAHPGWQGEGFHVFDSFQGLSSPGEEDAVDVTTGQGRHLAANMEPGQFAVAREIVARNLHRRFPRVALNAGWIPQVFAGQAERRYRFVHVDVDLYRPTLESLRYFHPRLAPGGIIISDDYEWPGARKAFEEFALEHALPLKTTATAQAFFVKHGAA